MSEITAKHMKRRDTARQIERLRIEQDCAMVADEIRSCIKRCFHNQKPKINLNKYGSCDYSKRDHDEFKWLREDLKHDGYEFIIENNCSSRNGYYDIKIDDDSKKVFLWYFNHF